MGEGQFEFKAFTLFSLLFGAGLAILADRTRAADAVGSTRFLVRRLLILLGLGITHLVLIWNGDILTLYAVCGLLLVPVLRLPTAWLAATGLMVLLLSFLTPWALLWPADHTLQSLSEDAKQVYTEGSFRDVFAFHQRETVALILPLLAGSLPKTWALMTVGAVLWRAGIVREPQRYRKQLQATAIVGAVAGGIFTVLQVEGNGVRQALPGIPLLLVQVSANAGYLSYVSLAFAYAAGLLLVLQVPWAARAMMPFAAVGQMALTNYLVQSMVLSVLFYGYGLGFYGQIGSAAAVAVGFGLYVIQMAASMLWLRHYHFGPVEWLWRSLTYGQWQPLRR